MFFQAKQATGMQSLAEYESRFEAKHSFESNWPMPMKFGRRPRPPFTFSPPLVAHQHVSNSSQLECRTQRPADERAPELTAPPALRAWGGSLQEPRVRPGPGNFRQFTY